MKIYSLLLLLCIPYACAAKESAISVKAQQHAKVKLLIGVVQNEGADLKEFADIVQKNLEFSGQFKVAVHIFSAAPSKKALMDLFGQGYPLAVLLTNADQGQSISWRLYDTNQVSMLKGKKYKKRGVRVSTWAHNLADALWPALTNQSGFFSTKIAYCKDVKRKGKSTIKHVYIADYDGSNERLLIETPTVNMAPRWNRDVNNPLLFYSEGTDTNIRLMVTDMKGRRKVASNFDGLNMLAAFSKDGKKVVYCASRGDGSCQLYSYKKGRLKKITNNNGNNVSPSLSDDGKTVYFCSDFQTGYPQIYSCSIKGTKLKRLTDGGYCAAPSYCEKKNQVAYSKIVQGQMQIFVYDLNSQEHRQLTFDKGNKEECSWSPCGNYLLFSAEHKGKNSIELLNLLINDRRTLTASKDKCCYPSWSPIYNRMTALG